MMIDLVAYSLRTAHVEIYINKVFSPNFLKRNLIVF